MDIVSPENSVWPIVYDNLSILELFCFVLFLYVTYLAVKDLRGAKATKQWPVVMGKVTAIDKIKKHFENHLEMSCEYRVNGKTYSTRKIFIDEHLTDFPDYEFESINIDEPPPVEYARRLKRILGGKISNISICFQYILSCFPVFSTLRTELISGYRLGDEIQIYYAPGNPEISIVKPGISLPFYIVLGLSGYLTLVVVHNIVRGIFYALDIESYLLILVNYFIIIGWCIGPLSLFLYLTGMAGAILKSLKRSQSD